MWLAEQRNPVLDSCEINLPILFTKSPTDRPRQTRGRENSPEAAAPDAGVQNRMTFNFCIAMDESEAD